MHEMFLLCLEKAAICTVHCLLNAWNLSVVFRKGNYIMYSTLPTKCMKSFCVVEKAAICTAYCLLNAWNLSVVFRKGSSMYSTLPTKCRNSFCGV